MSFEEFHNGNHGGHHGYRNGTILAILNLCVAVMLHIKFWLNLTYGLGGDVVWRISRWPPWRPSWILDLNNFSNSESLCHCDASNEVWLNPTYSLGEVICRISRWPWWRPLWISERNNFSNSECLCHYDALHQVLAQFNLWFGRRCRLKNLSWISERNEFGISEFLCYSHQVLGSIGLTVWEEISFEEFQDGHLN